jgi:hypothetical protein
MTINELQEFYDTLSEAESVKGKYGRNRLFNTKAMLQIVTDVNYLKNIYDNLKVRGKDIFGYHFNEIILSMLFLKYVRSNKVLFERYLKLRKYHLHLNKKNLEDKKLEKAKERLAIDQSKEVAVQTGQAEPAKQPVNETDTSAVDNYPAGPASFAKDVKNWRKFAAPIIKTIGATIVKTPLINDKTKFLSQLSEDVLPGDIQQGLPILDIENNESPDAITFSDVKIELINGIQPDIAIHELTKGGTLNVLFSLFNKTSETYILIVESDDYINFVCSKVNSLQDELDMETILRTIKQNYDIFEQTLKLYVLSEIDDSIEASDDEDDLIDYTNKLQPKIINTQPEINTTGGTETLPNKINEAMDDTTIQSVKDKIQDDAYELKKSFQHPLTDKSINTYWLAQDMKMVKSEYDKYNTKINRDLSEVSYAIKNASSDNKKVVSTWNNGNVQTNKTPDDIKKDIEGYQEMRQYLLLKQKENNDFYERRVLWLRNELAKVKQGQPRLGSIYNVGEQTNNQINTNNMINEEALPISTQQINKINKENGKSLADEIKSLNSQISKYFKADQEEAVPFEYDYDGENAKDQPRERVQYVPSKEMEDHIENNTGRGLEDIDYDSKPSESFLERLKLGIGEDKFNKLKDKAKAREMERKSQRNVYSQINDFSKTATISDKLKGLNESITSTYTDINNKSHFVKIETSSLNEATKEDVEKYGVFKLNYKGYGSLLESSTSQFRKELFETLDNFDFFYDRKEDKVLYILKENKNIIDKETAKKLKRLVNYDGGAKYMSNKLNNKPSF